MSSCSKQLIKTLFFNGIAAVKPEKLVSSFLKLDGRHVIVGSSKYNLSDGKLYIIGFGKAVMNMALKAETILGDKLNQGIISVPFGMNLKNTEMSNLKVFTGAYNNIPDENSVKATEEIIKMAQQSTEKDLLLIMVSGGGSALLSKPKGNITLEEKVSLITKLAKSGADIKELNCVRKRISDVKGGKLSQFIYPARSVSFILSDIVGDPLDLISSGPTVKNTEPSSKALEILKKYNLISEEYYKIIKIIEQDEELSDEIFENVNNIILANNKVALDAIKKMAESEGYSTVILSSCIENDVKSLSHLYAELAQLSFKYSLESEDKIISILNKLGLNLQETNNVKTTLKSQTKKICFLLGGETVVNVTGNGVGGRNQELALRVSVEIEKYFNEVMNEDNFVFLSGGTDGIDGPTDAAGAVTYLGQLAKAKGQTLDPHLYLDNNDSYNYFKLLNQGNDLVVTGHTGVNVMDVHILLINR